MVKDVVDVADRYTCHVDIWSKCWFDFVLDFFWLGVLCLTERVLFQVNTRLLVLFVYQKKHCFLFLDKQTQTYTSSVF